MADLSDVTGDLSLEDKIDFAKQRAAEIAAEKKFYDAAQPFYPLGFSIGWRNPGHWDVYAERCPGSVSAWKEVYPNGQTTSKDGGQERAFCIRGQPDDVYVRDERWNPHKPHPREPMRFKSMPEAMAWICEELMQEPKS